MFLKNEVKKKNVMYISMNVLNVPNVIYLYGNIHKIRKGVSIGNIYVTLQI